MTAWCYFVAVLYEVTGVWFKMEYWWLCLMLLCCHLCRWLLFSLRKGQNSPQDIYVPKCTHCVSLLILTLFNQQVVLFKTWKVRRRSAKDGKDQKTVWRLPRFIDICKTLLPLRDWFPLGQRAFTFTEI